MSGVCEMVSGMANICSMDGCDGKHEAHGFCRKHYRRWQRWGDPTKVADPVPYKGRDDDQIKAIIRERSEETDAGCWEWRGYVGGTGYGQLSRGGKREGAHRVSYRLFVGPIPRGLFVCHHCDNRLCVNPNHLFIGTAADNNADMDRKGRARRGFVSQPTPEQVSEWVRGEGNPAHILTEDQVIEIRASDLTQRKLATAYGVSPSTIGAIKCGRLWRHLLD